MIRTVTAWSYQRMHRRAQKAEGELAHTAPARRIIEETDKCVSKQ